MILSNSREKFFKMPHQLSPIFVVVIAATLTLINCQTLAENNPSYKEQQAAASLDSISATEVTEDTAEKSIEEEVPVEAEQTELTSALLPGETSPVDSTQQEGEVLSEVLEETSIPLTDSSEVLVTESPTESGVAEVEAVDEGIAAVEEQTEVGAGESEVIGPGVALESIAETETQSGTGEDVGKARAELPQLIYDAGEGESVSAPRLDLASIEAFQTVPEETPTVESGGSQIIYGEGELPARDPQSSVAIEPETAGSSRPVIGDSGLLDEVDAALASVGRQDGSITSAAESPTGTGTATNSEAETPDDSTEESEEEVIEADSVDELDRARTLTKLVEPVLQPGALEEGQRWFDVVVRFTILPTGLVKDVVMNPSSGISEVDEAIRKALRQWKFAPVPDGFPNVPVRLRYTVIARDGATNIGAGSKQTQIEESAGGDITALEEEYAERRQELEDAIKELARIEEEIRARSSVLRDLERKQATQVEQNGSILQIHAEIDALNLGLIEKLKIGMSKAQVRQIVGTKYFLSTDLLGDDVFRAGRYYLVFEGEVLYKVVDGQSVDGALDAYLFGRNIGQY